MEAIMNLVWAFLNSPIGITLVVSAVGAIVAWLVRKLPIVKKYKGVIYTAVKYGERQIPDDTENAGAKRLDEALKYALKLFAEMDVKVKDKKKPEIIDGLMEAHEQLEKDGLLGYKVYE